MELKKIIDSSNKVRYINVGTGAITQIVQNEKDYTVILNNNAYFNIDGNTFKEMYSNKKFNEKTFEND